MSRADDTLTALEKAANEVLENAKATRGGVGMACFATTREQSDAFARAEAKETAAGRIVAAVAEFKSQHGDFK